MSKCCKIRIINLPGDQSNTVVDGVVDDGEVVGTTLVLRTTAGGTVNIPLLGSNSAIDFSQLSPSQVSALSTAIRGNLAKDAFGVDLGYLLPL